MGPNKCSPTDSSTHYIRGTNRWVVPHLYPREQKTLCFLLLLRRPCPTLEVSHPPRHHLWWPPCEGGLSGDCPTCPTHPGLTCGRRSSRAQAPSCRSSVAPSHEREGEKDRTRERERMGSAIAEEDGGGQAETSLPIPKESVDHRFLSYKC